MSKTAKPRTCQNEFCMTRRPDTPESCRTFTLSTAMNEELYCSLACEKQVEGENRKHA